MGLYFLVWQDAASETNKEVVFHPGEVSGAAATTALQMAAILAERKLHVMAHEVPRNLSTGSRSIQLNSRSGSIASRKGSICSPGSKVYFLLNCPEKSFAPDHYQRVREEHPKLSIFTISLVALCVRCGWNLHFQ